MFWPKEWLPNEIGFRHVRLHSYGYSSDGSRKESFLTVHDFAQALLADIYNSPDLRRHGDVGNPGRVFFLLTGASLTKVLDAHRVRRPQHGRLGSQKGTAVVITRFSPLSPMLTGVYRLTC
jgi:hypothetical protein